MPLSKEQAEAVASALADETGRAPSSQLSWWKRRFIYGAGAGLGLAISDGSAQVLAPSSPGVEGICALTGLAVGILAAWRVARAVA